MKKLTKTTLISIALTTVLSTSAWAACSANLDMGGNKITHVATPTANSDATTKAYVDNAIAKPTATAPEGYGVIYAGGHAWLDRNLGATSVCTTVEGDAACHGDLYQWGRSADGHEKRTSAIEKASSHHYVPGDKFLYDGAMAGFNWLEDREYFFLWTTPGSGNNGICPAGWSVPTQQDFADLNIVDMDDAFDKLKLSTSGYRHSMGEVFDNNISGAYWTASSNATMSRIFTFDSGEASIKSDLRVRGHSVRCVKYLD